MSSALSAMFDDDIRSARKHRQSSPFSSEIFFSLHPELEGYVKTAGVTLVLKQSVDDGDDDDGDDAELFLPHYDSRMKAVILPKTLPTTSVRTAMELHAAMQMCALMLDQRDSHPDSDRHHTLIRIVCDVIGARYVSSMNPEQRRKLEGLFDGGNIVVGRTLRDAAVEACRWDDPEEYIEQLQAGEPIFDPTWKLLPPRDLVASFPSVPNAYSPMERVRQLLLRSLIDKNTASTLNRLRNDYNKRIRKMYGSGPRGVTATTATTCVVGPMETLPLSSPTMMECAAPFRAYWDDDSWGCMVEWLDGRKVVEDIMMCGDGSPVGHRGLQYVLWLEAAISDLEMLHKRSSA
eukprot:PhF_6_TR29306/c0_g1_i3/m.42974